MIEAKKLDSSNEASISFYEPPKVLWKVEIPKNGGFYFHYTIELSWWARVWMKFIGWDVEKVDEKINNHEHKG